MAHKKGAGSSRNGRDSNSQRLGVKRFGGDVVLLAVSHQNTLLPLRYSSELRAARGRHGGSSNRSGRCGPDLVVPVPPGTEAHDETTGERLGEVIEAGARLVVARGGRGG